jgi:hypothetical protein
MAASIFYFCLRKLSLAKKSLRKDSGLRDCLCSWRESVSGFVSGDGEDDGELVHLSGVFTFSLDELLRASAYVLGKSGVGIVCAPPRMCSARAALELCTKLCWVKGAMQHH